MTKSLSEYIKAQEAQLVESTEESINEDDLLFSGYTIDEMLDVAESGELNEDEENFILDLIESSEEYDVIDLDEAVDFSKMSKTLKKHVTYEGGGKDSAHEVSKPAKSFENLQQHIRKALKTGHTAVVHVDGKPVSAVLKNSNHYDSKNHKVLDAEGKHETKSEVRKYYGGQHQYQSTEHKSTEANDRASYNVNRHLKKLQNVEGHGDPDYSKHEVVVHSIGADDNRTALSAKRSVAKRGRGDGDLDKIKDSAATKLAKRVLGTNHRAVEHAENLHTEIGKHLKNKDYPAAKEASDKLHQHLKTTKVEPDKYHVDSYARALKSGNSQYSKSERDSIKARSGINESTEEDDKFDAHWKKHVPASGTADTEHGEAVRAIGRLHYEHYNNGNGNKDDQGRDGHYNTLGSHLVDHLRKVGADKDTIHSAKEAHESNQGSDYNKTKAHYEKVQNWLVNNEPKKHTPISDEHKKMYEETIVEELDLSDYSVEELESFMVSEDFEQLDEISGKLLGSYIQKARASRAKLSAHPEVMAASKKVDDLYKAHRKSNPRAEWDANTAKRNSAEDDLENTRKKIDSKYISHAHDNKRIGFIDKALKKLKSGKLTEEEVDVANDLLTEANDKALLLSLEKNSGLNPSSPDSIHGAKKIGNKIHVAFHDKDEDTHHVTHFEINKDGKTGDYGGSVDSTHPSKAAAMKHLHSLKEEVKVIDEALAGTIGGKNKLVKYKDRGDKMTVKTTGKDLQEDPIKESTNESIDMSADIDALFNGETLTEEFKEKASTIFEAAITSRLNEKVEEIEAFYANQVKEIQEEAELEVATQEDLFAQKLDEQIEEVKVGLVEHVDGFLNFMVEQWMKDNEVALESGIKAEIAENLVSGLHKLFTENYVEVPEAKVDLVEELEASVLDLEAKLSAQVKSNIDLNNTINEAHREFLVDKTSAGLTELDADKFRGLVEELSYDNAESFEGKLVTIKENYFTKKTTSVKVKEESLVITDAPVVELTETVSTEKKVNPMINAYLKNLSK